MSHQAPLVSLWMPIVLSTLATFVIGGIAWLDLPHRGAHSRGFPDERAVRNLLKTLRPGHYRIPDPTDGRAIRNPAFRPSYEGGPVAALTVERWGSRELGRRLGLTLIWHFAITCTTAYQLWHSPQLYPWGGLSVADKEVFGMAATLTFGFHAFGLLPEAIWFSKSWRRIGWEVMDAALYAVVTAGVFTYFWPPSGCVG